MKFLTMLRRFLFSNIFEPENKEEMPGYTPYIEVDVCKPKATSHRKRTTKKKPKPMAVYTKRKRKAQQKPAA